MDNYQSLLPLGVPLPVGDEGLWEHCVKACAAGGDAIQLYADKRWITRQQAKDETFTIRYGMWGKAYD